MNAMQPNHRCAGALLTDLYQLTMAYGYWKSGKADQEAVFELFFRKAPFQCGFTIAAGILVHWLLTRTPFNRKIYQRMSVLQYVIMQTFLIIMLALPVKILLRQLLRIKYVWITPWFNI